MEDNDFKITGDPNDFKNSFNPVERLLHRLILSGVDKNVSDWAMSEANKGQNPADILAAMASFMVSIHASVAKEICTSAVSDQHLSRIISDEFKDTIENLWPTVFLAK